MTQQSHSWANIQTKFCIKKMQHSNVHCRIIRNSQTGKQVNCPPTDEWIEKTGCILTTEYYRAIKRMK